MASITITPDALHISANQCRNDALAVNEVMEHMEILLNHLNYGWTSELIRSYSDRYQELMPSLINAKELILQIAESLDSTANTMEETEAGLANMFIAN